MIRARNISVLTPYIIIALFAVFFGSCADTSESDNGDITKYIGTWNVVDQSARINYSVTIQANPSNSAEIIMNNFADLGSSAIALVVGDILVIDSQQLSQDYTVSGSGSFINNNKLEFNFDLNDGIDSESRVATFTK
jgi:hypothetical protein